MLTLLTTSRDVTSAPSTRLPTCSANALLGYPQWSMAGDGGRLISSQWQRLPANCQLFQQVPLPFSHSLKAAQSLVQTLDEIIAQYGPQCPVHWQWLPFTVEEFESLMQRQSINHITSPHFHHSNGFQEQQVKTIKTALSTTQDAKTSLETLLLELQSTPIAQTCHCPRKYFITIPSSNQASPQCQWIYKWSWTTW